MNVRNNTRILTMNALLLAIGVILHQITPVLGLPMQPDFALTMLFIIILLNDNFKITLVSGTLMGIFTAMTTKFPGGQLPNLIDKFITAIIIFTLITLIKKTNILGKLNEEKRELFLIGFVLPFGTLISGLAFLGSAQVIVGLPASFMALFLTVVVPSIVLNTVVGIMLYKVVMSSLKRVSYSIRR
ncbi:tryptophan transporter [Clostridium sp. B9]|uniref:tryptophan transporter n=1 Tax=Clostridium sp. B9 TaxID=3423224 RepID=UPI003D2EBEA0